MKASPYQSAKELTSLSNQMLNQAESLTEKAEHSDGEERKDLENEARALIGKALELAKIAEDMVS